MPTVEFWRWEITDPVTGKRSKTRYRMREADALATDATATKVPGSLELRELPESPRSQSTGDYTADPRIQE